MLIGKGLKEDLQLVLPKFLLPCLVEEWEVSNMVTEYVSQQGQV